MLSAIYDGRTAPWIGLAAMSSQAASGRHRAVQNATKYQRTAIVGHLGLLVCVGRKH